jgi:cytidylate kinase
MAGNDSLRKQVYASMDERDLSWCEEALRSFLDPNAFKNDYFHQLTKTILSLVRQGNAVFVGRGADLILPPDAGLRVRIIAPLEMRIRNLALRQGTSEDQARKDVEKLEMERAQYVRRHFHADVHDDRRYDLVINLRRISPTQAAEIILTSQALRNARSVRNES